MLPRVGAEDGMPGVTSQSLKPVLTDPQVSVNGGGTAIRLLKDTLRDSLTKALI